MFGMAEAHRSSFEQFLRGAGVEVTLEMPPERSSGTSDVDKVLGVKSQGDPDYHVIQVVWSNDLMRPESFRPGSPDEPIAALGGKEKLDAVVRTLLSDVLLDVTQPLGPTLFDTAKYLIHHDMKFEIVDTKRTGLPPLGPYIIWAGLRLLPLGR